MAKRAAEAWFVYILRCVDGTLYTGITKDLARRTRQHNDGVASRYTRSRRPVVLVYQEPQGSQSLALKREAAIKKLTRRQKLAFIRAANKGTPKGWTSRKRQAPRLILPNPRPTP